MNAEPTSAARRPRTPKPGHSLADRHPDLTAEWAHDLNGDLTPADVGPGSHHSPYWRCTNGHTWRAPINNRTGPNGTGCRSCSMASTTGPRTPKPGTSLADLRPALATEWHPTKNDLSPNEVTPGSHYPAWWLCPTCGHEWQRPVKKRSGPSGTGCRKCAAARAPGGKPGPQRPRHGQSLADLRPDLAAQWHPTRNDLAPTDVKVSAGAKVWWAGPCGHEWQQSPEKRSIGQGCTVCAGKIVIPDQNSLAALHPEIAAQWDTTKNGDLLPTAVTPGTTRKVWWTCQEGHSFDAAVSARTKGTGCRYCAGQAPIAGVNDLTTTHPDLATQFATDLNGTTNVNDLMMGSNQKVWWRGECSHTWLTSPNNRTSDGGRGCPFCAGKRVLSGFNDLASQRPDIAESWATDLNAITAAEVTVSSAKDVYWRCADGHVWKATPALRTSGRGCPSCSGRVVIEGVTDLATVAPHLVPEWHPVKNGDLTPQTVTAHTGRLIWWLCPAGHEYAAQPSPRVKFDLGCSQCSGRRVVPGETDLATKDPRLASEWHPLRNELAPSEILATSHARAWWRGSCGHEWDAVVRERFVDQAGCPVCKNRLVLAGHNDLATHHPSVAAEWAHDLNEGLTPSMVTFGTNRLIWWRCAKQHVWKTSVVHRTLAGSGCPDCYLPHVSRQELRLAFELAEHVALLFDNPVVHGATRRHRVDMFIPANQIVIEFDGAYWHRDKHAVDMAKTQDLEAAGYQVIRVREPGLLPINTLDVVAVGADTKNAATSVLRRLAEVGAVSQAAVSQYEACEGLLAEGKAAEYIRERLSPPGASQTG